MKYEQDNFWDLYQSCENDIWSYFENLLVCPDFNALEEIFNGIYLTFEVYFLVFARYKGEKK